MLRGACQRGGNRLEHRAAAAKWALHHTHQIINFPCGGNRRTESINNETELNHGHH